MIGSGTVWPAGFFGLISFVSSGTVTGSGRVKGCGFLTGTGTFTVSGPYTETITESLPSGAATTVNVYVSYCPQEMPLMRLVGNLSTTDSLRVDAGLNNGTTYNYLHHAVLAGGRNYTNGLNSTTNSTKFELCRVCPEDAGICCPPYSDCGADGHCPWNALVGSGYARFGVNIVDVANSSQSMGMTSLPDINSLALSRLRAPGLPGNRKSLTANAEEDDEGDGSEEVGLTEAQRLRRRLHSEDKQVVRKHLHAHGRIGRANWHGP